MGEVREGRGRDRREGEGGWERRWESEKEGRREEGQGREEDVLLQPSILCSYLTGSIPLLAVAT